MTTDQAQEKRVNELLLTLNKEVESDRFFSNQSIVLTDLEKVQIINSLVAKFKIQLIDKRHSHIEKSKEEQEKSEEVNNAIEVLGKIVF